MKLHDDKENTTAVRVIKPVAVLFVVFVSIKVAQDKKESFYGVKTNLDESQVQAYIIFASLCALWFVYELVLTIRFFLKKR